MPGWLISWAKAAIKIENHSIGVNNDCNLILRLYDWYNNYIISLITSMVENAWAKLW